MGRDGKNPTCHAFYIAGSTNPKYACSGAGRCGENPRRRPFSQKHNPLWFYSVALIEDPHIANVNMVVIKPRCKTTRIRIRAFNTLMH